MVYNTKIVCQAWTQFVLRKGPAYSFRYPYEEAHHQPLHSSCVVRLRWPPARRTQLTGLKPMPWWRLRNDHGNLFFWHWFPHVIFASCRCCCLLLFSFIDWRRRSYASAIGLPSLSAMCTVQAAFDDRPSSVGCHFSAGLTAAMAAVAETKTGITWLVQLRNERSNQPKWQNWRPNSK